MLGAAICAVTGAASDVHSRRIPNWLTYGSLALALAVRGTLDGWRGLGEGAASVLLCGGFFFILFLIHAMGGGDVKLMAAVSAWVGIDHAVVLLISTALAGGILAVVFMVFYKRVGSTLRNIGMLLQYHTYFGARAHPEINAQNPEVIRLPYGLAIAIGTLYLLFSASNITGVIYGH
jgi:prepilin peptidase CpaA